MSRESYPDVDSLWGAMLDELFENPTSVEARAGSGAMSHEVIGTRWRLADPRRNFLTNSARAACPAYASAELLWYLSRSNSVEMLLPYAPSYKKFAEPDGHAYGAYGKRIANNIIRIRSSSDPLGGRVEEIDQLDYAVQRLKRDPNTRQLVISLWKPSDLITEDKRDMPCTILWQFILRENNLHMIAYMRSNDAWLGTCYDIYAFTCIQMMLAASIGAGVGHYTHVIGSLHLYERDREKAFEALTGDWTPTPSHEWEPCKLEDAHLAVLIERALRTGQWDGPPGSGVAVSNHLTGCLSDSVACCGMKLGLSTSVKSPALAKGFDNAHRRRTGLGRQDDAGQGAGAPPQ